MSHIVTWNGKNGTSDCISIDISTEEGFLLYDRLQKISSVINRYGEDKFYMSYSGGKDSVALSHLLDMAVPGNQIPRIYINTGIELNMVRDFVFEKAKSDERIVVIQPQMPIIPTLEKEGYPFKSKNHARIVERYQRLGMTESIRSYLGEGSWGPKQQCPKKLRYQFTPKFDIKLSDKCCLKMKEEPLENWGKQHNRPYALIGIMPDEGGRRSTAKCMAFKNKKLSAFQPLVAVDKKWEEWFIENYNVTICDIYKPPYNSIRTGCKGCPFALHLQEELDMLEKFFPNEKMQCERIWKPVYEEYRRIGYRLEPYKQISLFDCFPMCSNM